VETVVSKRKKTVRTNVKLLDNAKAVLLINQRSQNGRLAGKPSYVLVVLHRSRNFRRHWRTTHWFLPPPNRYAIIELNI
jgi:hypothetical protein